MYPILNEITSNFIKNIQKNPKILVMFFYNEQNEKQNNFVFNEYKKIAFENRKYVFGFADKLKDPQLIEYFKINPNSPNINIVIFNFKKDIYYIHPNDFDINSSSAEKCEKDIKNLIENMNNLKFTTGNFLEDLFLKFGIQASSNTIQLYIMLFLLFIIIFSLVIIICCCETNENDDLNKMKKE